MATSNNKGKSTNRSTTTKKSTNTKTKKKYRLKKDLLRQNRKPTTYSKNPSTKTSSISRSNNTRKPVKVNDNKAKKTSKTTLLALAVIALITFIISVIIFGFLIAAIITVLYGILVFFTQILDNNPKRNKKRKTVKVLFATIMIFGIIGIIGFIGFFAYIVYDAPSFDVEKLERKETSLIYDSGNKLIATLGTEKREKISYNELPQVLIDAIVATEDSRFFQHNGFDAPRFAKATLGQLAGSGEAGGGSTLTMQVSKNNFTSIKAEGFEGIMRKFSDIYLSIFKIEKAFTKQEIIEFYINAPFLGNSSFGVEQASQTYFNKSASELTLSEASLIAGLFQAPSSYDPIHNPEAAEDRRSEVLNLMVRHGYITKEEKEAAASISVEDLLSNSAVTGIVVNEYQDYIDTVIEEIINKTGIDPYVVPVIIHTNMDRTRQTAVNNVFNGKNYNWINSTVQGGAAVVESKTGKIVAIGAGRNRTGERTFNYATDIDRQIGSTSKPLFDYGPGIEYNNWSTGKNFLDAKYTYSGGAPMTNFDGGYKGNLTLRESLRQSRNVTALKAFQQVDNEKILEFVTSLGITPEIDSDGRLHEAHSIGAFNGSNPLSMAAAYAAFSNGGYYYEPYTINKIVIRESNETLNFKSTGKRVMSEATAYMITSVLQMVASDAGVSNLVNPQVALKTGTTDYDAATRSSMGYPSNATNDGWIAGYTPSYAMAMWTGYVKNVKGQYIVQSRMVSQRNGLYRALAKAVYTGKYEGFTKPSSVVSVTIERGSDPVALPSAGTPSDMRVTELFKRGTEPTETSGKYISLPNVSGLAVSYSGGVSNIAWNRIDEPKDSKNGTFGYKIYKDGTYLGFTTNNYYGYTTASPYGTYKVISGFDGTTANQSSGATYTLANPITFQLNFDTSPLTLSISNGDTFAEPTTPILAFENLIDVTSSSSLSKTITRTAPTNQTGLSFIPNVVGTYVVSYTLTYSGVSSTSYKKTITVVP